MEFGGRILLAFEPLVACGRSVDGLVLSGTRALVPSGTGLTCYREPREDLTHGSEKRIRTSNIDSNQVSNFEARARNGEAVAVGPRDRPNSTARKAEKATSVSKGIVSVSDPGETPELPFDNRPESAR